MQESWIIIWPLQGLLMLVDEFFYHRKRGLDLWERVGHPIDTFTFFACFAYTILMPFTKQNIQTFIILGILSSLIITKDEWVHHNECNPSEQWIHSFLFLLHPLALFGLYTCWFKGYMIPIYLQSTIIFCFFIYQIFYWNFKRSDIEIKHN